MESRRQLIDSLTSHIALYNSHSPSSSPNPNPNPRSSILKWFSSLTPHQRQSHLTIVDKSFTQLLIQMQFKVKNNGHGSFIILPDIPSSSSNPNIPSFCFRKSHGLLTRISKLSNPEKCIRESVQLFDSKEGENFGASCCSCLDSVTVSIDFVENMETFINAMDGVSNGEFLRGEESALLGSLDWVEFNWLKARGYYSVEAFVANRLELALRLSWLHLNIGKKRGVKLKEKSVSAVAGVAANVYWRKKGCVDWWVNLDNQTKSKIYKIVFGKATKFLTQEILNGKSSGVEDELQTTSGAHKPPSTYNHPMWHQETLKDHRFNRLLVVSEILTMLQAFDHGQFDEGVLFFTSLGSVSTISDRVFRRLRGLLMVVSLDFTKLELLEDLGSTKSTKNPKPKPKLDSCKKGKTRDVKKPILVQKSLKSNCLPEKPAKDEGLVVHETVIQKETQPTPIEMVVNVTTLQTTSKKAKRAKKKHKKNGIIVNNPTKTTNSQTTPPKPVPENPDAKIPPKIIPTSTNSPPLENSNTGNENVKKPTKKEEKKPVVNYGIVNPSRNSPYEWPNNGPQLSFTNSHLPTTTDRLHLDVGHNWQNHYHQPGFLHTVRNRPIENGCTEAIVHPRPIPMSLDWPPMVHSFNGLVPYMPRPQSFKQINQTDDRIYSGEFDSPEFVEEHDSHGHGHGQWVGEEDFAVSGMDYSQYFGGGVMYWDSSDHPVAGFSRPPSLSSDDSSWAWQDADMNRNVDDMVAFSSPSGASFCSAFDPIGYVIPNEVAGKVAGKVTDEKSVNVSNSLDIESKSNDLFPYPILRPVIISRDRSRREHKSPPVKRPPSPVVLCGGGPPDSRKHQRGFPTVRSGSSSPRNWGVKGWFHDGINFEEACLRVDGSEVVWPSWRKKSQLPGALIAISQENHPDLAIPIQPPESESHSVLPVMQLNDEIDSFCKRVAGVNLTRKPYINWAVKRVTRSLQVLWPRSRTNIFGSNATGLSLPTSDVDLVVCLPPVRNLEPIKEAGILEGRNGIKETCLQHAARYLANQEWVKPDSLKIVENTAIPIIMLIVQVPSDLITPESESESELESIRIDISFKAPSHTGLQTTELVKELTEQFPAATPLALVLKQFLSDRSLDQSYSGGLSSYCLILLITRFLQHEHHYGVPINQNFGGLLMDFFYFFGNVFDPRQMRISVQGSGVYINRERGYSIDPIYIDDPLYPANNVGRNCFRIHQCIKAFADAYSTLEDRVLSVSEDCESEKLKLLPLIIPSVGNL